MEIKDLIQQGLKDFADQKDSAILDEISRLSSEGHILLVMVKDSVEQEGNTVTFKGGLKLTTPKYDQLLADARELQKALVFYENLTPMGFSIEGGEKAKSLIETFTKKYGTTE